MATKHERIVKTIAQKALKQGGEVQVNVRANPGLRAWVEKTPHVVARPKEPSVRVKRGS